jgi:hypothetical protein
MSWSFDKCVIMASVLTRPRRTAANSPASDVGFDGREPLDERLQAPSSTATRAHKANNDIDVRFTAITLDRRA